MHTGHVLKGNLSLEPNGPHVGNRLGRGPIPQECHGRNIKHKHFLCENTRSIDFKNTHTKNVPFIVLLLSMVYLHGNIALHPIKIEDSVGAAIDCKVTTDGKFHTRGPWFADHECRIHFCVYFLFTCRMCASRPWRRRTSRPSWSRWWPSGACRTSTSQGSRPAASSCWRETPPARLSPWWRTVSWSSPPSWATGEGALPSASKDHLFNSENSTTLTLVEGLGLRVLPF